MTEPDMWLSQKGTSELISMILQTKEMNKTRGDTYRAMNELNLIIILGFYKDDD